MSVKSPSLSQALAQSWIFSPASAIKESQQRSLRSHKTSKGPLLPLPQELVQFDTSYLGSGFQSSIDPGVQKWCFGACHPSLICHLPSTPQIPSLPCFLPWRPPCSLAPTWVQLKVGQAGDQREREERTFLPRSGHTSDFISLLMSIASVRWPPIILWFEIRNIYLTFVSFLAQNSPKPHTHTGIDDQNFIPSYMSPAFTGVQWHYFFP